MEYILKNNNATATVTTLGGELIVYSKDDVVYTWTGDEKYWAGRAPILFPNVCALKDSSVKFEGKPYTIEKHGFARRGEYKVLEHDDTYITLELCDTDATLKMYPYHFSLKIIHTLLDDGFKTEYMVTNTGDSVMPFCIGGHPGFRVPIFEGEKFSDYSLVFEKEEKPHASFTTKNALMDKTLVKQLNMVDGRILPLNYSDFEDDALIFENLNSEKVSLLNGNRGMEFSFAGFPALGVWTPPHKDAPFICLEPWYGVPAYADEDGNFENKPYAIKLAAGDAFSCSYSIKVLG